ncbi:MAG TPA: pyruvate ferredoxin oxidoreductase [Thermoplasmata archaeon]|nr:pyruvate ferredoxin oxidoreductase [Thermoplasmata archaeon]
MYETRFHGRGGQGAVTAANLLATAAFKEGKFIQSFPIFGTERRGAPVAAFVRVDSKRIRIRSQIYKPDAVVVLDPGLTEVINITEGLKDGGLVIINTKKMPTEFGFKNAKVVTVDATGIASRHGLGSKTAPIVNTAILGAYLKATEQVDAEKIGLSSLLEAIKEGVPSNPKGNVEAAKEAHEKTKIGG